MNNFRGFVLTLACTTILVLAASQQAQALTANGWTTPPTYRGVCPATIELDGMISSGFPGAVMYTFTYLNPVTNSAVKVGPTNGTLDGNGAAQVSTKVSLAAAGNSWVQLTALQGPSNATSTTTTFTVTCTSSAPPPTPAPPSSGMSGPSSLLGSGRYANTPMLANTLTAPSLRLTTDPSQCPQHAFTALAKAYAPKACGVAAAQGRVILLWDWAQGACSPLKPCPSPQGFNVYTVRQTRTVMYAGGGRTRVGGVSTQLTMSTPASGHCYGVTAFNAEGESNLSNIVCANAIAPQPNSVTLSPTHMRSTWSPSNRDTGFLTPWVISLNGILGHPVTQLWFEQQGVLHVGTLHGTDKSFWGDSAYNEFWRGALFYDLGALGGKNVTKAILHFHVQSGFVGMPPQQNAFTSCARVLDIGNRDWWNDNNAFDGNFAMSNLNHTGPDIDVDVTSTVQGWMGGAQNFGFILKSDDENNSAFTENSCETLYDAPQLEVDF